MKVRTVALCTAMLWSVNAYGTVVFQTGFETYSAGSTLASNGWTLDGAGTAVVTNAAGLARSGSNAALFTPGTAVAGTWGYRTETALSGATLAAEPVVTISSSLRITSPASGTANRGVTYALQAYDSLVNEIADVSLVWDPQNTVIAQGANNLYLFCDWFTSPSDTTGGGFGYNLGAVTSAQLASVGYFDVSITLNYASGDIQFAITNAATGFDGTPETTHGTMSGYADFSDADYFYQREATGGTLPQLLADNYSIVTSAVPEPASLAGASLLASSLMRRRRNA